MITMMLQFKYTPDAMKAILLSGEDRSEAIKKMIEPLGGNLICTYGMQGQDYHIFLVYNLKHDLQQLTILLKEAFSQRALALSRFHARISFINYVKSTLTFNKLIIPISSFEIF